MLNLKNKTFGDLSKSIHATKEGPICFTGPSSKFWCLVKWQIKKPVGKGHVAYLIGISNCIVWGYSNNAIRKNQRFLIYN